MSSIEIPMSPDKLGDSCSTIDVMFPDFTRLLMSTSSISSGFSLLMSDSNCELT